MTTIIERITELRMEWTDTKVKAYLTIENYSAKDIAAAFKELGGANSAKGFAAEYYDWLAESPRSGIEAAEYIKGDGEYGDTTANVKKHLSHYLNIHALADTIWSNKTEVEAPKKKPKAKAKA